MTYLFAKRNPGNDDWIFILNIYALLSYKIYLLFMNVYNILIILELNGREDDLKKIDNYILILSAKL